MADSTKVAGGKAAYTHKGKKNYTEDALTSARPGRCGTVLHSEAALRYNVVGAMSASVTGPMHASFSLKDPHARGGYT